MFVWIMRGDFNFNFITLCIANACLSRHGAETESLLPHSALGFDPRQSGSVPAQYHEEIG